MTSVRSVFFVTVAIAFGAACSSDEAPTAGVTQAPRAAVTDARLRAASAEPANWLAHGRTYDEQRFSPLNDINKANAGQLGLAWYFDLPTRRGMEATPIVVDGTMYVTGSWSIVYALDAATGQERWRYDPQVPKSWARYACCDVVNRGVAVWENSVLVGTLDGYLVSLDATTGKENWRVDTIDRKPPYTVTGAPRVINGLVLIGNGGAEFGVRGYVSAYDARTGALKWRFHTVPGNPADGFENDAMKMAATSWRGQWWTMGGGGTVWDSMAYDPQLDLLYIGVGNGSPWNRKVRSPGGGDNLFLSSIVALRPDTGEYVWHYQTTPGDTWDYTATQHMILADIEIGGAKRKVLMQAPKNGFFYVLDRTDGSLISANSYVNVNWATSVDPATGRPVEAPNARYEDGPFLIMPSPLGGHNWHPMAFNPARRLVYLPTQDLPYVHGDDPSFKFEAGFWNTGTELALASAPDDPETMKQLASVMSAQLIAWDPVEQREVWRYQHVGPWNGGALATAGDLVFQGSLIGEMAAYDAGSGERLWQFDAQTGIAAAPMTYAADGQQYVAVAAGWGTIFALTGGEGTAALQLKNRSRILAFKLEGDAALPAPPAAPLPVITKPPSFDASPQKLALGKRLFSQRCGPCHGDGAASGGVTPDLRRATAQTHAAWEAIVLGGAYSSRGMPGFDAVLSPADSDAIQSYVLERTQRAWSAQQAAP